MALVAPLDQMTTQEKLQLMELLWADLTRDESAFESPSWHGAVLKEREVTASGSHGEFKDWQTAKKELRDRLR